MKKRLFALITATLFALSITACDSNDSSDTYVSSLPDNANDTKYTFLDDTRVNFPLGSNVTFDGRYLISSDYLLDTSLNTIRYNCNIVGCKHNDETCEANRNGKGSKRACNGGFYITLGNKLYFRDSEGNDELLFTNDFTTEMSKEIMTVPSKIGVELVTEKFIILNGCNYIIRYDLETNKADAPIVVYDDQSIFESCLIDNTFVTASMSWELNATDIEAGKVTKLTDYALKPQTDGEYLYYIDMDNKRDLVRCKADGSDKSVILSDVYDYAITDKYIIYKKTRPYDPENDTEPPIVTGTYSYMIDDFALYKREISNPSQETRLIYTYENEKLKNSLNNPINLSVGYIYWFPGYENIICDTYDSENSWAGYVIINPDTGEFTFVEQHMQG